MGLVAASSGVDVDFPELHGINTTQAHQMWPTSTKDKGTQPKNARIC